MASRGKGARNKGANFERLIANKISEDTGLGAKRGLAQVRGGGAEVSDVDMPLIHIEAKNWKVTYPKKALEQAVRDISISGTGKIPVAVTKDLRKPILVTMYYKDWIDFFKAYIEKEDVY